MPDLCTIPGNSDIAGIGVRVAVYLQASLVVLNSFALGDQPPGSDDSKPEYKSLLLTIAQLRLMHRVFRRLRKHLINPSITKTADVNLERSLFITGLALIISAFIAASNSKKKSGLTDYHALVVLNLSVLNYWAGYNLLRRRTDEERLSTVWALNWLQKLPGHILCALLGPAFPDLRYAIIEPKASSNEDNTKSGWQPFITRSAFYIHATAFSALGIWFWTHLGHFQRYINEEDRCSSRTVYWAFFSIPVGSHTLKVISLVFYGLFILPILNGWATSAISQITAFVLVCVITLAAIPILVVLLTIGIALIYIATACFSSINQNGPFTSTNMGSGESHSPFHLFLGQLANVYSYFEIFYSRVTTVIHTGPIIYWIVATEKLVKSNTPYVADRNEMEWSYGQVMALLAAFITTIFYSVQILEDKEMLEKVRGLDSSYQEEDDAMMVEHGR